jgi:hypothetical protein
LPPPQGKDWGGGSISYLLRISSSKFIKDEEKVTYEEKNSIENISEINGNDDLFKIYKPKKSKDILFSNKKNRLIFEERRHLVKEEKNIFVATENLLANEETSRDENITDINREPVVIVSF